MSGPTRRGIAFPALLVAAWLTPVVGLLPSPPSEALGYTFGVAAFVAILWWSTHPAEVRRRALAAAAGMVGAAAAYGVVYGLGRWAGEYEPVQQAVQYVVLLGMPVMAAVVGVWAVLTGWRERSGVRWVAGAWIIAIASLFAVSPLLYSLSFRAGNAGLDVISLFVMPVVAAAAWAASAPFAPRDADAGETEPVE